MDDDTDIFDIDPREVWLEKDAIAGFRVWHIIAAVIGILMLIMIMVCCCIRFRIPRTKQEIEADYQRKQITKKFREKLQQIKNSEMDDMDLQKGKTHLLISNWNSTMIPKGFVNSPRTLYKLLEITLPIICSRIQSDYLNLQASMESMNEKQNVKFKI